MLIVATAPQSAHNRRLYRNGYAKKRKWKRQGSARRRKARKEQGRLQAWRSRPWPRWRTWQGKGQVMPIRKVKGGWTFGGGTYKSKKKATRSYKAYLAKKHTGKKRK